MVFGNPIINYILVESMLRRYVHLRRYRKCYNEEILTKTVTVNKSRRVRQVEHLAYTEDIRNAYTVLIKTERTRTPERLV